MGNFVGMNVEEVNRLGGQLKQKGSDIDGLINQINGLIDQLQANWRGKDADTFKGWWESQHRPALTKLRDAVNGLGDSAINNAKEQSDVSNH